MAKKKARYIVVIQEQVVETVIKEPEWAEGADTNSDYVKQMGYTPEIEHKKIVTRIIYEQNTDTLNLTEVIKAINGIK